MKKNPIDLAFFVLNRQIWKDFLIIFAQSARNCRCMKTCDDDQPFVVFFDFLAIPLVIYHYKNPQGGEALIQGLLSETSLLTKMQR